MPSEREVIWFELVSKLQSISLLHLVVCDNLVSFLPLSADLSDDRKVDFQCCSSNANVLYVLYSVYRAWIIVWTVYIAFCIFCDPAVPFLI